MICAFNDNMKPTTETIYMRLKQTDTSGDMVSLSLVKILEELECAVNHWIELWKNTIDETS